jgi:hypothetical protein
VFTVVAIVLSKTASTPIGASSARVLIQAQNALRREIEPLMATTLDDLKCGLNVI